MRAPSVDARGCLVDSPGDAFVVVQAVVVLLHLDVGVPRPIGDEGLGEGAVWVVDREDGEDLDVVAVRGGVRSGVPLPRAAVGARGEVGVET